MVNHLFQNLIRHSCNIGTGQCAIGHMNGIAHTGGDDLGLDVRIVCKHLPDGMDQINARLTDIVQSAKEGADIRSTSACRQQCLICGENQGAVGGNAFCGQHFDSFQSFCGHGNLHDHMLGMNTVPEVPREMLHLPSPTAPQPMAAAALSPAPAQTTTLCGSPSVRAASAVRVPTGCQLS